MSSLDCFGRFPTVFGRFRTVSVLSFGINFGSFSNRFRSFRIVFGPFSDESILNFKISNFNWPGLGHRRAVPSAEPSGPSLASWFFLFLSITVCKQDFDFGMPDPHPMDFTRCLHKLTGRVLHTLLKHKAWHSEKCWRWNLNLNFRAKGGENVWSEYPAKT